jgi:hypothetical protein
MSEAAQALREWDGFFVIVGSSAGALTGLQFVVLTLIADSPVARRSDDTIAAFGSPNVVHFCAALLISAIFSAPWHALGPAGIGTAVAGGLGVLYSITVMRRAMLQKDYQPVMEDWIWHAALPTIAYAALLHAGIALRHESADTLYIVGAATLLLVFVGIHNAWDTVTYVTLVLRAPTRGGEGAPGGSAPGAALKNPPSASLPANPTPPRAE